MSRRPTAEVYSIEYALAEAQLSPAASGVQAAAWIDAAVGPTSSGPVRSASLKIEYPHPALGPGAALATLSVYDDPHAIPALAAAPVPRHWWNPWNALTRRDPSRDERSPAPAEVVTLSIPRAQFEMLMRDLHREDYSDDRTSATRRPEDRAVSLAVSRNHHATRHSSVSEPRLDEFVQQVYRDGVVILGDRDFDRAIVDVSAAVSAPDPAVVD